MSVDAHAAGEPLVTGAEIARLAGVTRAAVSNWRRRHDDFPAPAGGRANSPLFLLSEVRAWLARQDKVQEVSAEARLWQLIGAEYGDDVVQGLAAVARLLADGCPPPGLSPELVDQTRRTAELAPAAEVVAGLTERFLDSSRRSGTDHITSARIVAAVRHFTEPVAPDAVLFDPACGIGTLLLALGPASGPARFGQEVDPAMAEFAALRAGLTGREPTRIRSGDSLRADRWPELTADLVVCDPPVAWPDWGREELLLDGRWELGIPSRAEGELAWLQHAYAHTAPGGRTVVVMPASVAYRKAGRRIRAELVRRGILTQVVGLPPGTATGHSLPVHLWFLVRPVAEGAQAVRMVDLSANRPEDPFDPQPAQVVEVPLIDLLDDVVDLTPASHVAGVHRDYAAEYAALRSAALARLAALGDALPPLARGAGAGSLEGASVGVADLARAGLVEFAEGSPVSTSDQLDTDFLRGFLLGAAARRRATATTSRLDVRGARVPQMPLPEQRRYGTAFRALLAAEEAARDLAALYADAAALAREALANGSLVPPE
jgi:hypothetical protein